MRRKTPPSPLDRRSGFRPASHDKILVTLAAELLITKISAVMWVLISQHPPHHRNPPQHHLAHHKAERHRHRRRHGELGEGMPREIPQGGGDQGQDHRVEEVDSEAVIGHEPGKPPAGVETLPEYDDDAEAGPHAEEGLPEGVGGALPI